MKLCAKDIANIYNVSERTARRYMHQMGCETKPLRVTEAKMKAWDKSREEPPVYYSELIKKAAREKALMFRMKARYAHENS